jgi:hypothetical protein
MTRRKPQEPKSVDEVRAELETLMPHDLPLIEGVWMAALRASMGMAEGMAF